MSPLRDRLKAAMAARGLSQRDLAKAVGCRESMVSEILSGRRRIPKRAIPRWADALGLTGDDRDNLLIDVLLTHADTEIQVAVERMRERLQSIQTGSATTPPTSS